MTLKVEIYTTESFAKQWDQKIKDAQTGRSTLKAPRLLPLPGNRVVVFRGLPFTGEFDVDPDAYR